MIEVYHSNDGNKDYFRLLHKVNEDIYVRGIDVGDARKDYCLWEALHYKVLFNPRLSPHMEPLQPRKLVEILAARGITIQEFLEKICTEK